MLTFKDLYPNPIAILMPHDHVPLAQSPNGELGPLCHGCGIRLTFGQSIPIDEHYACWDCYQKITGRGAATAGKDAEKRFYR
jgi:hypothetical protein